MSQSVLQIPSETEVLNQQYILQIKIFEMMQRSPLAPKINLNFTEIIRLLQIFEKDYQSHRKLSPKIEIFVTKIFDFYLHKILHPFIYFICEYLGHKGSPQNDKFVSKLIIYVRLSVGTDKNND